MSDATTETWLRALDAALSPLPAADRADIVNEARGHLEERIAAGLTAQSALHGFGAPKSYAQTFIDDYQLTNALKTKRIFPMIKTLFGFAHRSLIAFFGLMAGFTFGAIALGAAVSIILKTIRPDKVGMWVGPGDRFNIGTVAGQLQAHEIAGNWIYLVFIGMILAGIVLAHISLFVAIRSIKGQRILPAA